MTKKASRKSNPSSEGKAPSVIVEEAPKGPVGRPPSLIADESTLDQIERLARLQPSLREAGAFFGVSHECFRQFIDNNKKASDAWERGIGNGMQALRRRQMEKALDGDTTMLIWLGKQYLKQKDTTKQVEVGSPGEFAELEDMSDAELAAIARGSGSGIAAQEKSSGRSSKLH